jgi:hypothetical protein
MSSPHLTSSDRRLLTFDDIPPDVISRIVEMSKKAILKELEVLNNAKGHVKDKEGVFDELKVRKLRVEEVNATRITVDHLASKSTKGEKAKFGHLKANIKASSLGEKNGPRSSQEGNKNNKQSFEDEEPSVSRDDDTNRGFETVSEATANFESVASNLTTCTESSSHMDTDLDCDSDLEGSIKSVEVAFEAIEDTLQTFKETIASGPSGHGGQ